ncbi:hypothetical protein RhiirB3_387100 [Rhizophagus irregularis]|nr:hypothetical protein RhiirB3_387100 [Rhizophagus irregularis]
MKIFETIGNYFLEIYKTDNNPIKVNIRRFILKILATYEATEWSLLKNNQELCYANVNQIDWKITWLIFHYCKGFHCTSMQTNYLWTFIAKLFHKILPLGSILALRKPKLYKEMKCVMNCNKKENWNHLFECQAYKLIWQKILEITTEESIIICLKQKQIKCQGEDFIRNVLQDILGVTAKSKKFQKFQHLALEVKVETCLTTKLQTDFKITLTEAQMLMANILIRFILAFKELLWKPRCEQVILWEKRKGITRTDKITTESKIKDNTKDNLNQPSDKAKDIKTRKADRVQKSIPLVKKSMDTFIKKYICEDWIPIKKKFDKVTLYISKKLLE